MNSKAQEKIFVPSDYFFWSLIGLIACFAIFNSWNFKIWQIVLTLSLAVFILLVFNFRYKWLALIWLVGFTVGVLRIVIWSSDSLILSVPEGFLGFLDLIKNQFSLSLTKLFPEPVAGFAQGIILGGKDIKFSFEFWNALKITSTAHLIAVSGYNVTLIARYISKFLAWTTLHRKLIWIFASLGVIVFVIFVGAPASAVRAGVLSILMLVAQRFGREGDFRISLTFALALMVFLNPLALNNDLGMQLSFLASFGIFYLAPLFLQDRRDFDKKDKSSDMKTAVIETLSAQAMVLPLLLYKFGTLSLVGLVANFILVPWIWLVMGLSFFSVLGMIVFEPLGKIIGLISFPFLNFFVKTIEFFASLPMAGLSGVYVSSLVLIFIYVMLFILIIRLRRV